MYIIERLRISGKITPLRKKIILLLKKKGDMRRSEIVKMLNSSRTTIYDNLKMLEDLGIVERYKEGTNKRGRPYVYWRLK